MGEGGDQLFADLSGDDGKGLPHGVRAAHGILDESCHLPYERRRRRRRDRCIHFISSHLSQSGSCPFYLLS